MLEHQTQPEWNQKDEPLVEIGDPITGRIRVIAFSAGGTDNVFQFGLVHAFLVSGAVAPHIITGTSTGTIVGAMLADVLQAPGPSLLSENPTKEEQEKERLRIWLARVAKFRMFLNDLINLPAEFQEAAFPDLTEVSAHTGLLPLDQPTQLPEEKRDREQTALVRFGLIQLFNGLLAARVTIAEMTRLIRLSLDYLAAGEYRLPAKWKDRIPKPLHESCREVCILALKTNTFFRIWLHLAEPTLKDAPLILRCVMAPGVEKLSAKVFWHSSVKALGLARLRDAKSILFESFGCSLVNFGIWIISYPIIAIVWALSPAMLPAVLMARALHHKVRTQAIEPLIQLCSGIILAGIGFLAWSVYGHFDFHSLGISLTPAEPDSFWPWLPHTSFTDVFNAVASCAFHFFVELITLWVLVGSGLLCLLICFPLQGDFLDLLVKMLGGFHMDKDLFSQGVLRKLLIKTFDPAFFGEINFTQAVDRALSSFQDSPEASFQKPSSDFTPHSSRHEAQAAPSARKLSDWMQPTSREPDATKKSRGILVLPVAADINSGQLVFPDPKVSVVDALIASCALTPWFAPHKIEASSPKGDRKSNIWLVDGACVAREPIQPVLDLIKRLRLHRNAPHHDRHRSTPFHHYQLASEDPDLVEVCIVSPHPTQRVSDAERNQMLADMAANYKPRAKSPTHPIPPAPLKPGTLYRIRDILALQAAHAAKDERNRVILYNAILRPPPGQPPRALFCSATEQDPAGASKFEHWHVYAALREVEPDTLLQTTSQYLRAPDRTAKRSLILGTIATGCRKSFLSLFQRQLRSAAQEPSTNRSLPPCSLLAERRTSASKDSSTPKPTPTPAPTSSATAGPPGIAEICKECSFYTNPAEAWVEITSTRPSANAPIQDWGEDLPAIQEPLDLSKGIGEAAESKHWPEPRERVPGNERPTVSLVLSGGVFRGVFQVGVLNALNLCGLKPDVVAGASVGTIMAALGARLFAEKDQLKRRRHIASVAATFLGIDRLILTDRLADFIRRLTLRAGAARFSLRDADHLFRRFDRRRWEMLTGRSRRVLAGLHRVLYLDPLELVDILSHSSPTKRRRLPNRLLLYAQDALNRSGIGNQILGAEPLEQLIRAHVLTQGENRGEQFDDFLRHGNIQFLATTTNLTTLELDVLGSFCNKERQPALVAGLLASSAFPAVFRARMNWEVRASSPGEPEELIDGGITDNLPIIPVYRFLFYAGLAQWIKSRPVSKKDEKPRPHLLLTASLEPRKAALDSAELDRVAHSWPKLSARVNQLRYNVKVDSHAQIQKDVRAIRTAFQAKNRTPALELLDLHISCVKPEWLCGTFAFHPMLGFRRKRQAMSIAHGCALTLAHLHWEQTRAGQEAWAREWWTPLQVHTDPMPYEERDGEPPSIRLQPHRCTDKGHCCILKDQFCPFSKAKLEELADHLPERTRQTLSEIYKYCGEASTHLNDTEQAHHSKKSHWFKFTKTHRSPAPTAPTSKSSVPTDTNPA